MKIDNRTDYPTRRLRSLLCAVHNAQGKKLPTWGRLVVEIGYRRRGDRPYTGHAHLNGYFCRLTVPRPTIDVRADHPQYDRIKEKEGLAVAKFCALWDHEILHLYGVRHRDFSSSRMHCKVTDRIRAMIPDGFPDRLAGELPKAKPKPTLEEKQRAKVDRLLARRKAWIAKAKRALTALEKIDRSLAYYARQGLEVGELEERPKRAARPRRRA